MALNYEADNGKLAFLVLLVLLVLIIYPDYEDYKDDDDAIFFCLSHDHDVFFNLEDWNNGILLYSEDVRVI